MNARKNVKIERRKNRAFIRVLQLHPICFNRLNKPQNTYAEIYLVQLEPGIAIREIISNLYPAFFIPDYILSRKIEPDILQI